MIRDDNVVMRLFLRRSLAGVAVVGLVILGVTGPASAHVTIHSPDARQGGSDALLQIRVPDEKTDATTIQVEVDFPISAPMLNMYVQPVPGWNFQVTQSQLPKPITTDDGTVNQVVTKVVWSGGHIPVGGYQDFDLDVSKFPSVPSVELKALQTYSDGDVVRWIEDPAPPGQPEPDHPAPILTLTPAAGGTAPSKPASQASRRSDRPDPISIVALIIGALGLLAGAGALVVAQRARHMAAGPAT